jgi:hypothetical protein
VLKNVGRILKLIPDEQLTEVILVCTALLSGRRGKGLQNVRRGK